MVKDTIIEEKNCFSDDSARRFMQTIQQMSCNISNPDLSLHSSPSRPYPLCLSGFREVKSFLYLFTPLHPYRICNTLYAIWEEKKTGDSAKFPIEV